MIPNVYDINNLRNESTGIVVFSAFPLSERQLSCWLDYLRGVEVKSFSKPVEETVSKYELAGVLRHHTPGHFDGTTRLFHCDDSAIIPTWEEFGLVGVSYGPISVHNITLTNWSREITGFEVDAGGEEEFEINYHKLKVNIQFTREEEKPTVYLKMKKREGFRGLHKDDIANGLLFGQKYYQKTSTGIKEITKKSGRYVAFNTTVSHVVDTIKERATTKQRERAIGFKRALEEAFGYRVERVTSCKTSRECTKTITGIVDENVSVGEDPSDDEDELTQKEMDKINSPFVEQNDDSYQDEAEIDALEAHQNEIDEMYADRQDED